MTAIRTSREIHSIMCPVCGTEIFPPEDMSFKFISREKLRQYTKKYEEKKKQTVGVP